MSLRIWLRYVVHDETLDLPFDICRLISYWNLGQTRKVDQGEIEDARPVYL